MKAKDPLGIDKRYIVAQNSGRIYKGRVFMTDDLRGSGEFEYALSFRKGQSGELKRLYHDRKKWVPVKERTDFQHLLLSFERRDRVYVPNGDTREINKMIKENGGITMDVEPLLEIVYPVTLEGDCGLL